MSLFKMFPVLLLLPALTLADGDDKFKVHMDQFKVGGVMKPIANMAIICHENDSVSMTPSFPLKANTLYLRHKIKAKEYQWFLGDAHAENLKKLYAYNLKENHLRANEVVCLRFYASMNKKAFQDESDIYFDREYLYSSHLPELYFMKNGKWQVLKKSPFPGMISITSDEPELEIKSLTIPFENTPKLIYPLADGVYSFSFSAPDRLPVVDVGRVRHDEVLDFKVKLPSLVAVEPLDARLSVSEKSVAEAKGLEETEVLYDKFLDELQKNVGVVDTSMFDDIYPARRSAAYLDLNDTHERYVEYCNLYAAKRQEAHNAWRTKRLGNIGKITTALEKKLDSLQQLPLSVRMLPTSVETVVSEVSSSSSVPVALSSASSKMATKSNVAGADKPIQDSVAGIPLVNALKLQLGVNRGRIDVEWVGTVDSLSMDSLAAWLVANDNKVHVQVNLVNNKPVRIVRKGELLGRHHYRYEKVIFFVDDKAFEGKGEFILPAYIANEPEVREWFKPKPAVPVAKPDTVKPDTVKAPVPVDTVKVEKKAAPETPKFKTKIIEDKYHGTVAVVDSGSFRFRGHVVEMSPFAIHTTEVTQEFFKEVMSRVDSTKRVKDKSKFVNPKAPVHNINWDNARLFCKTLGGDLPTEAQWEFAGRAGDNEGSPWTLDEDRNAGKYAVYFENSCARGKADSAYGPQPVCGKKPNAWGLCDMSGNVAEWTVDSYFAFSFGVERSNPTGSKFGTNKVYKGGSWKDKEKMLNMTAKDDEDPRYWSDFIGFRCVFPLQRINGLK